MLGAGAICVKIFKQFLIAACYDGNIYIFDINSDDNGAINITGPSNMLLAMDLWEGKVRLLLKLQDLINNQFLDRSLPQQRTKL